MPRKKLRQHKRRSFTLHVRLTVGEAIRLRRQAKVESKHPSAYARDVILRRVVQAEQLDLPEVA